MQVKRWVLAGGEICLCLLKRNVDVSFFRFFAFGGGVGCICASQPGRSLVGGMFGTSVSRGFPKMSPHTLRFLGAFSKGSGNQMMWSWR